MELLLILLVPMVLWIWSIYLLSNWDKFRVFFIANGILIIAYVAFLIYGKSIWGHDEYGLGFLLRLATFLLSHVVIVFIFALIKKQRLKE